MIDSEIFHSYEHFETWWQNLNPQDTFDIHEAKTIFFNLETYDIGAI